MGVLVDQFRKDVDVELGKFVVCEICEENESQVLMLLKQRNVLIFAHLCTQCKELKLDLDCEIDYISKMVIQAE